MLEEICETQPPQATELDLRRTIENQHLAPEIKVSQKALATDKWDEMLGNTQQTKNEWGVIISCDRKNNYLTSKIFSGFAERTDYNGHKISPSITPPSFPHGLKSFVLKLEDIVFVHTHPIVAEIEHLPTTVISADDIAAYTNSAYRAVLMIDKGGIHMLTVGNPHTLSEIKPGEIVKEAFRKANENTNTVAEVREKIAKSLFPYGIRYYFSSGLKPNSDGFVYLKDAQITTIKPDEN